MAIDLLFKHISQLFTGTSVGMIEDAAVGFVGAAVEFVGPSGDAPAARVVVEAPGLVGMPGLVDSHTHALFAGSRAEEFERRLAGASYTEILEHGGGILSTVRATRQASETELVGLLGQRLEAMLVGGVAVVEVKSGYGLDETDGR